MGYIRAQCSTGFSLGCWRLRSFGNRIAVVSSARPAVSTGRRHLFTWVFPELRSGEVSDVREKGKPEALSGAERKFSRSTELPRPLRRELATLARKLAREHRALFASDLIYRKRAGQFLTALLPPKPRRRGWPGRADVTAAIRLLGQLHRPDYGDSGWPHRRYLCVGPRRFERFAGARRDSGRLPSSS